MTASFVPPPDVVRVRVRHRLDTESSHRYRHRVRSLLRSGRPVVIHFPAGAFVDAQGLWILVGLADLGRDIHEGESLAVASSSREVDQLINLTRLDRYVPVFEQPDAAAAWLEARRGDEIEKKASSTDTAQRLAR